MTQNLETYLGLPSVDCTSCHVPIISSVLCPLHASYSAATQGEINVYTTLDYVYFIIWIKRARKGEKGQKKRMPHPPTLHTHSLTTKTAKSTQKAYDPKIKS